MFVQSLSPSRLERLLMLFKPASISYDFNGVLDCKLKYKTLFGKTFVISAEYGIFEKAKSRDAADGEV